MSQPDLKSLTHALLQPVGRPPKPRHNGITIMIDKGQMGPRAIADFAEIAGEHCDFAKVAWGSALITGNLDEKLDTYRKNGITPLLGGTLFEYAYLRNRVQNLLDYVRALSVHIEISDGVIEMSRSDKLRWIERFAKHVEVFSEVGGKIVRQKLDWNRAIAEELAAGSQKVVVEGREIGPVGVKSEADVRHDFVEMLVSESDPSKLVFEAFERRQQVWLIKRFGPNVNLCNIPPADLLTVESFRQGLKEHTLLHTYERSSK